MFSLLSSCLLPPPCLDWPAPSTKPTVRGKPCRWGKQQKNAHFLHQKNLPHQIAIFMQSSNTSFIYSCSHCCCIIFFNFRFYVHIYDANFDYLMVIESYLQHDKSTEWSKFLQAKFPISSPPFNAIWKTLLQLLLVFLFTPSLFIPNFINFF